MPLTGYNTNTVGSIISGAGVLMVGTTLIGVSRGGLTFTPGAELKQLEADGLTTPAEQLDRITAWDSTISGNLLQASEADLVRYYHGQPFVTTGAVKTLTPRQANSFLPVGAYLRDVRMIVQRGDGMLVCVYFPSGLITTPDIKTQDKNDAEFAVTISARLILTGDPGQDLSAPPFRIEERTTLPAA